MKKSTSTKRSTAAIYCRVSTDMQSTENQERELRAAAEHRGLEVVHVYHDKGISGAKGRDKRPGLDMALKDAVRGRYGLLMSWSVDRLGRSLQDLVGTLQELHGANVDLYLHQQGVDTRTPAGKAMFQMLGVFAEFERSIIVERVKAGVARARAEGVVFGRPPVAEDKLQQIRDMLSQGVGILKTAKTVGVGTSVAQKVAEEMRRV